MPFSFEKTFLDGVILVTPKIFLDERGFFFESYKKSDFFDIGIREEFLQDNHSKSIKGVIRGLHFQKEPYAQGKLVRCVYGEIFDVAVDIRKDSPTFGKWYGTILSAENKKMLWIPKGFAHGFLTLSETAEIIYKVSGSEYNPSYDAGIIWNDPSINIAWPLEDYGIKKPILSSKDESLPLLKNIEV